MESTEATVDVYAHLRATERMCTRACVSVNTFVRLSAFACTTCKYTRRAYVGTHCVTCVSVHRTLHPYKSRVGMFCAVSIPSIIIIYE